MCLSLVIYWREINRKLIKYFLFTNLQNYYILIYSKIVCHRIERVNCMNGMNGNNNTNLNTTNTNVNASKLKNIIKSKGFVTTACGVLAVIVLLVAYNIRIRSATQPVSVPVATKRLTARHLITEEDIRSASTSAISAIRW